MLDAGLPEPVFETEGFFTVTLYRKATQSIQTSDEPSGNDKINSILAIIKENPTASSEETIRLTGMKRSTFYNHLNKLKTSKRIKKIKKNGKWLWIVQ